MRRRWKRGLTGAAVLVLAMALVLGAARERLTNWLIAADVRLHLDGPRWAHRLAWDASAYDMLERRFERDDRAWYAIAVLLRRRGYPDGFSALRDLVEEPAVPSFGRCVAAGQLPWIRHAKADRYVGLLLDNTPDDLMRCFVLEGFWSSGRCAEGVELFVRTAPKMRDPESISRALEGAPADAAPARMLPLVLRYARHESPWVREAALAAAHGLFWDTNALEQGAYHQIAEMWRRAAADQTPHVAGLARGYIYEMEHVGLPRGSGPLERGPRPESESPGRRTADP